MKRRVMIRALALFVTLAAVVLFPIQAVGAPDAPPQYTCPLSATVTDGTDIEFVAKFIEKVENDADDTATYIYTVTVDSPTALSHWAIQFCETFFEYLNPVDGASFVTPGSYTTQVGTADGNGVIVTAPGTTVTGRAGIPYVIEHRQVTDSFDDQLKWEENAQGTGNQLGDGGVVETGIFSFTLPSRNIGVATVDLEMKTGGPFLQGSICGPAYRVGAGQPDAEPLVDSCDPMAVCLMGIEAKSSSLIGWVLNLLGLE